ncbi:MAG: biotin carboxylase N-terminal domain-containing protein [Candidatus Calescibacterium sp.]|nr:ATP-grasp domain-containing protein [Candidatus Calescibacterium sp.]MDW8133064.1 biotin carboxylase N-terminal domain-containing protein [Candidatus Calescibacterium sp.]
MRKVLVANRGEIAVRIIRTLREMGLKSVAVYSEVDKDSLHVSFADEAVCIGRDDASSTYLNIPNIISAALITRSDAIHPGYGFLSENYKFAQICRSHNIIFIGPSSDNIRDMGDKVKAKDIANSLGVPLIPSTGVVKDLKQIYEFVNTYGFPVIIKAAGGGGGRGMRVIENYSEIESKLTQASLEAKSFFSNPDVYVEKLIVNPKHIEVQIIGDNRSVYHLFERDCTVQRRHQKIIEEATSLLPNESRMLIIQDALKIAEKIGYTSAGTIEFLYDSQTGKHYFIEMNTRIQVEHPATEMVTNTDIVRLQVLSAMGEDISGFIPNSFDGYSIELRIYAEDSYRFTPSIGTITRTYFPSFTNVRVDTAVYSGYTITQFYDNMICKLIVKGKDREEAIKRARIYLDQVIIEGVNTNIQLLKDILLDENYVNYLYHTRSVDELIQSKIDLSFLSNSNV